MIKKFKRMSFYNINGHNHDIIYTIYIIKKLTGNIIGIAIHEIIISLIIFNNTNYLL